MSFGTELDRLAARWTDHPGNLCFAPLAEGLRKSGALDEAAIVATRGVTLRPDYLPGHLVLARIYRDRQQWLAADGELRAALALDADHPVVLDAIEQLARRSGAAMSGVERDFQPAAADEMTDGGEMIFSDLADGRPDEPQELVVTESLAMLYWGQGHHQQALDAFDTLIGRQPGNADLRLRRDMVHRELLASRPAPYDSAESGGRSVRQWLAAVGAVKTAPPQRLSGFDAFYETPTASPPAEPVDLEAFQDWLRELER